MQCSVNAYNAKYTYSSSLPFYYFFLPRNPHVKIFRFSCTESSMRIPHPHSLISSIQQWYKFGPTMRMVMSVLAGTNSRSGSSPPLALRNKPSVYSPSHCHLSIVLRAKTGGKYWHWYCVLRMKALHSTILQQKHVCYVLRFSVPPTGNKTGNLA